MASEVLAVGIPEDPVTGSAHCALAVYSMADPVPAAPQAGGGTLIPMSMGSFCSTSADAEEARRTRAIRTLISPPTRQRICSQIKRGPGSELVEFSEIWDNLSKNF
jgi:Phenazine biosynthesis-like protein